MLTWTKLFLYMGSNQVKAYCLSINDYLLSIVDAMFSNFQVKSWLSLFGHTGKSSGKALTFLVIQHFMSSGLMQSTGEAAEQQKGDGVRVESLPPRPEMGTVLQPCSHSFMMALWMSGTPFLCGFISESTSSVLPGICSQSLREGWRHLYLRERSNWIR